MALEVLVIISNCGGATDFVENNVSGLQFATGSAPDLARCITELARDASLRTRLARHGRNVVAEKLDSRILARHVEEVYNHVLASG